MSAYTNTSKLIEEDASQKKDTSGGSTKVSATFNFLGLSAELRVMIYARIPKTIRHYTFIDNFPLCICGCREYIPSSNRPPRFVTLVDAFPDTRITETCRFLRAESKQYVQEPDPHPRLIANIEHTHFLRKFLARLHALWLRSKTDPAATAAAISAQDSLTFGFPGGDYYSETGLTHWYTQSLRLLCHPPIVEVAIVPNHSNSKLSENELRQLVSLFVWNSACCLFDIRIKFPPGWVAISERFEEMRKSFGGFDPELEVLTQNEWERHWAAT